MSKDHSSPASRPWYREESWLAVGLVGIVITMLSFALPESSRLLAYLAAGTLGGVSLLLLILKEIARPTPARRFRPDGEGGA